MVVRKAKFNEQDQIIEIANAAFRTVRPQTFDFKFIMPKAYSDNINSTSNHYVIEENNQIIAVGGNIIKEINYNNERYSYSLVGTVSTLPQHTKKGCMKMLINKIDQENRLKNVDFSLLTGRKERYNYFSYIKTGMCFSYTFDHYFIKHHQNSNIIIRPFKDDDLDNIYDIYLKNCIIPLRKKDDMILSLMESDSRIFILENKEKTIGYFSFSDYKKAVHEIFLLDYNSLEKSVISIINYFSEIDEITFSPFSANLELIRTFNKFSDKKAINDKLLVKVYHLDKFFKFVLTLNKNMIENFEKYFRIENNTYCFIVQQNNVDVYQTENDTNLINYSLEDFIELSLGFNGLLTSLFSIPLIFDFPDPDLF